MSRRHPHVSGTTRQAWHLEIATGGDPVGALIRAANALRTRPPGAPGSVWSIKLLHDDGCASLDGGLMPACTCEIVELEARKLA